MTGIKHGSFSGVIVSAGDADRKLDYKYVPAIGAWVTTPAERSKNESIILPRQGEK